jgi:hypothetical protein
MDIKENIFGEETFPAKSLKLNHTLSKLEKTCQKGNILGLNKG